MADATDVSFLLDLGEDGVWECGSNSSEEEPEPVREEVGCICSPGTHWQIGTAALRNHIASQVHRDEIARLCSMTPRGVLHVHQNGRQLICDTAPGLPICSAAELAEHLQTSWHRFNLKRLTASSRLRSSIGDDWWKHAGYGRASGAVTRPEFDRIAALPPRPWHSKTGRIRCRQSRQPPLAVDVPSATPAPPPAAAVAQPAAVPAAAPPAAAPPALQRMPSWAAVVDVIELVLYVACEDPFSQAGCVCSGWRDAFRRMQMARWHALRSSLHARRAAAAEAEAEAEAAEAAALRPLAAADSDLAAEIDRLVRSFGTATNSRSVSRAQPRTQQTHADDLSRHQRESGMGLPPPPFDFAPAIQLLREGAGTGAIAAHPHYYPGGAAGVPWFDPDPVYTQRGSTLDWPWTPCTTLLARCSLLATRPML